MFIPIFHHQKAHFDSRLFDQTDFYRQFIHDLSSCKNEVIIESPFISASRIEYLYPVFKELVSKNVPIYVITRDPCESDNE